jgi:hypothetical protein
VWRRCDQLSALHAYLANNTSSVLQPDELLRAEWIARVGALDLYIHELVAQQMLATFERRRPPSPSYLRFRISNETLSRIRLAASSSDAGAAFDLEVRNQLSLISFQEPEKIAEGVRLCSEIELWNEVAVKLGAAQSSKVKQAKSLKKELSIIVRRRNQIAHEGDLQPTLIREPWPIQQSDLSLIGSRIDTIVRTIDALVCAEKAIA